VLEPPVFLPGEHFALECSWIRLDDSVTLACPVMAADLTDLGTFSAFADATTQFVVDGSPSDLDTALQCYQSLWGDTRVVVGEDGHVDVFAFGTRGGEQARQPDAP
jgi:hypothetical protein